MITKKDLMLRINDLEFQLAEQEERIYVLELANKPKMKRTVAKVRK